MVQGIHSITVYGKPDRYISDDGSDVAVVTERKWRGIDGSRYMYIRGRPRRRDIYRTLLYTVYVYDRPTATGRRRSRRVCVRTCLVLTEKESVCVRENQYRGVRNGDHTREKCPHQVLHIPYIDVQS